MCIQVPLRVTKVSGKTALMEDGRIVRLGAMTDVVVGDYLDVYADLAMGKVEKKAAKARRRLLADSA